jgi:hypothetical protein
MKLPLAKGLAAKLTGVTIVLKDFKLNSKPQFTTYGMVAKF